MLGAGVQNALQLQLAQLAVVDNVVCDALIQRIRGAGELYRAACVTDSLAPRLSLSSHWKEFGRVCTSVKWPLQ